MVHPLDWKLVDSKYIVSDRWLKLRADRCKPAEDETERLEIVTMPLQEVIKLTRRNGLFQALHVASLFFAFDKLGRISFAN